VTRGADVLWLKVAEGVGAVIGEQGFLFGRWRAMD
jgi:hypothetical protein